MNKKFCSECGKKLAKEDGLTYVQLVLDESGSMFQTRDETIDSFNAYVDELKNQDGNENIRFGLTKFNTVSEIIYSSRKLDEVPKLTRENFTPGGFTALLDAIGNSIDALNNRASDNDRVLFVILTDGGENSSRWFTTSDVNKAISKRKDDNWTFVFLGADQEAWSVSRSLGISAGNTTFFGTTTSGRMRSMSNLAHASASYAGSGTTTTANFYGAAGIDNTLDVDDDKE